MISGVMNQGEKSIDNRRFPPTTRQGFTNPHRGDATLRQTALIKPIGMASNIERKVIITVAETSDRTPNDWSFSNKAVHLLLNRC